MGILTALLRGSHRVLQRAPNGAAPDGGAVLVTVSLSMVAIVAAGALALDLGMSLVERRQARNAADHAALAAAWANCNGDTPQDAADASVVRNGYSTTDLTLTEPDTGSFQAVVSTNVPTRFAGVVGFGSVQVTGTALASCSGGSGGSANAIFAGGECSAHGKPTLEVNGSSQNVYGGIHSNDNVQVPGSSNDFGPGSPTTDPFTYSGNGAAFQEGGSGNSYDPGFPAKIPVQDWPVLFQLSDYEPGSAKALAAGSDYHYIDGDLKGDDVISMGDGLYYVTGNVDMDKTLTATITIVAEGEIKFAGSNQVLTPYVDHLLAFSGFVYTGVDSCDKFVVTMSGSSQSWSGIIYGPHGLIEFPGSSNTTLNGSLIGYAVRLNGSNLTIQSDPSFFDAGDGSPQLLQ